MQIFHGNFNNYIQVSRFFKPGFGEKVNRCEPHCEPPHFHVVGRLIERFHQALFDGRQLYLQPIFPIQLQS